MCGAAKALPRTYYVALALCTLALLFGLVGGAQAGTVAAVLNVSVTITGSCAVSASNQALDPDVLAKDIASPGLIAAACTVATPYSVGIDRGVDPFGRAHEKSIGGAAATPRSQLARALAAPASILTVTITY